MFILSGLILEVAENLFRDFGSSFSISFVFFSAYLFKKKKPTMGRVRPGLRQAGSRISRGPTPPLAQAAAAAPEP